MTMLRHLVILARESSLLPAPLTIALDRHFSRGDQVEIIEDRRRPPDEPTAEQWFTGRERRRAGTLADQLRTQGYAIISRDDEAQAVVPPPRFERAPVHRAVAARAVPTRTAPTRTLRNEHLHLPRDERQVLRYDLPEDFSVDRDDDRDEFDRPRRRGGLVTVVIVGIFLAGGLYFFSPRLTRLLTPPSPPAETARAADPARPAESVTEEPARAPSRMPDAPASTPSPAAPVPDTAAPGTPSAALPAPTSPAPALPAPTPPAPALPAPTLPPSATSATQEAAPAERALPPPSASASLPPRRVESSAPEPSSDPAPPAARSQRLPDFPGLPRVEVSRTPGAEGTIFTVRLSDPRGRPLPDAQVWLREKSGNGFVRETPLGPVSPAGSYRGAVQGGTRRSDELTVRIELGDRRVEMPLAD